MTDEPKRTARADGAPRGRTVADERKKASRKKQTRETLVEMADLLDAVRGRGDQESEDLAEIIRRDADRMAETFASMAARFGPAAFMVDHVFGAGGPLSVLTSFGPFLRSLIAQAREVRMRQLAEHEAEKAAQHADVFPFDADAATG